ncbi:MAG TPA: hypothetical protein VF626_01630 [Chthoniobacterales bacterium]
MRKQTLFLIFAALTNIAVAVTARAERAVRPGFTIPEITLSPDKRFGVLVPDEKRYDAGEKNKLIEVSTDRVLAVIAGEPGMERMNHGGIMPARWAPDSSLLLWCVSGKWFPRALVLIKLSDGAVAWQLDLLKTAQQEILARARQAAPEKYAAAKKQNAGNGSAYPEGFTVDVTTDGDEGTPIVLPLRVHVTLTSNPKGLEDYPKNAELDATLEGEVASDGKFKVLQFKLKN